LDAWLAGHLRRYAGIHKLLLRGIRRPINVSNCGDQDDEQDSNLDDKYSNESSPINGAKYGTSF
jgi:hypothetical protein